MKTVGIIGGLGPDTTARFYMEVVLGCLKSCKTRPSMLIANVALPLKMEEEIITKAQGEKRILPFLLRAAEQLENGGADFIVIPCNTVHQFIKEIRGSVHIPVLNILEETAKHLAQHKVTEIGLLATQSTVDNKLFHKQLQLQGIKINLPNKTNQTLLGKIIFHVVKSLQTNKDREILSKIIKSISSRGVNTMLLACTDLQSVVGTHQKICIFDTMQILADATVREILK